MAASLLTEPDVVLVPWAAYLVFGGCLIGACECVAARHWFRSGTGFGSQVRLFVTANYASLLVWGVIWLVARALIAALCPRLALEHLGFAVLALAGVHLIVKTLVEWPAFACAVSSSSDWSQRLRRERLTAALCASGAAQLVGFVVTALVASLLMGSWPLPGDRLTSMTFSSKTWPTRNEAFMVYYVHDGVIWRKGLNEGGRGETLRPVVLESNAALRVVGEEDAIRVRLDGARGSVVVDSLSVDLGFPHRVHDFYLEGIGANNWPSWKCRSIDYRMPGSGTWYVWSLQTFKSQLRIRGSFKGEVGGLITPLCAFHMVRFNRPVYVLPDDEFVAHTRDGFVVLFNLRLKKARVVARGDCFCVAPNAKYGARLMAAQQNKH